MRHLVSTKKIKAFPDPKKKTSYIYGEINLDRDYKFNPYNYPKDSKTYILNMGQIEEQKKLRKQKREGESQEALTTSQEIPNPIILDEITQ